MNSADLVCMFRIIIYGTNLIIKRTASSREISLLCFDKGFFVCYTYTCF